MIEPINPPSAPAAPARPEPPTLRTPGPLQMRAARDGARRFIVQFAPGTPLPEDDEITCTREALAGILPEDVQHRLCLSEATAWMGRLYPNELGAELDAQDRATGDGDDPGFARYYHLRLTAGPSDEHILDTLSRVDTIALVQPELDIETLSPKNNPNFKDQSYLKPAPAGISAETAWNAGATGSGITIGFAESGIQPSTHADISIAVALGQSGKGSTHILNVAGILAAHDNTDGIIGVAHGSQLVFSSTDATPGTNAPTVPKGANVAANAYVGIALLANSSQLKAGDVVNFSIGANVEIDQGKSPQVGPSLPKKVSKPSGNGLIPIAMKAGSTTQFEKIVTKLPLEADTSLLALVQTLTKKGVTVCMAAGNGYEAAYRLAQQNPMRNTSVGADTAVHWIGEKHVLDRSSTTFKDGGGIVVTGAVLDPKIQRVPGFNFGNRIDCFAQGSDVATWDETKVVRINGTSAATPIISGAAALVQSFVKAKYQKTLRPRVLRALLSDTLLGTSAPASDQAGVMPDLSKLFTLLTTTPFDKAKLRQALKTQAASNAKEVAKAKAAAAKGSYVHDPYAVWDDSGSQKQWRAMAWDSDDDIFNP